MTWLVVGLVSGLLAAAFLGGVGSGLIGDMVTGMAGATFGGWLAGALGLRIPLDPGPAAIVVALIGATTFLLLVRTLNSRRQRA